MSAEYGVKKDWKRLFYVCLSVVFLKVSWVQESAVCPITFSDFFLGEAGSVL
jgi:hypothetical protein